eukprot:9479170-Pyramimonas_sp.AAC.1
MLGRVEFFRKLGGATYVYFIKSHAAAGWAPGGNWEPPDDDDDGVAGEAWFWGVVMGIFGLSMACAGCE